MPGGPLRRLGHDDRGSGLFAAVAGVVVFLAFLLLAVQLLFNLYATSVVTSVAYDAAREVATSGIDFGDGPAVRAQQRRAQTRAEQLLGKYADRVEFSWSTSLERVRLRVEAINPTFLLPALRGTVGFDTIDRTVEVRVERER